MIEVMVARKAVEAADVCTFELVAREGGPLPAFAAGSHIDVHLPGGLSRQYSLCNSSDEQARYIIGVLKDPRSRGGSRCLHEDVHEGDVLRISAPKNHFPLAHDARRSILLAGGIGVTPILCMAERLAMLEADFEMHYATRSRTRTAFLSRIAASRFAHRVTHYFDDEPESARLDFERVLASTGEGVYLYVCGPQGFIDAAVANATRLGWAPDRIRYEFFGGALPQNGENMPFQLRLASTGRVLDVKPGQSALEVLARAGIDIPSSCEQGVCGTCATRVLEGTPDHRDMYLSEAERAANDQFMPCCSRARTPVLVLDI